MPTNQGSSVPPKSEKGRIVTIYKRLARSKGNQGLAGREKDQASNDRIYRENGGQAHKTLLSEEKKVTSAFPLPKKGGNRRETRRVNREKKRENE